MAKKKYLRGRRQEFSEEEINLIMELLARATEDELNVSPTKKECIWGEICEKLKK